MALIKKQKMAYISRTINLRAKWSALTLVKSQESIGAKKYEKFSKLPLDGSDQKISNGSYLKNYAL